MAALEAVSFIRNIALIVAVVTVTIASVVLLRRTNRLSKRIEVSFDKIGAVGQGIGTVAQAVVSFAVPQVEHVKTGAAIFRMALRRFRRKKQPT